ncbi:MAG: (2Fe-2S) ferredoxin domain-containing protein [Leptospiraceae bacterium]|nr:(2Fe-2S) ferredoxin domain-containing protein [Leptospiraceae bacterium]MCP5498993.1 (2Fe-2S) ferredoxin domain-containing protein [Leptospiraceae bacterium]
MSQYYEKHIFVCENVREDGKRVSCGSQASAEIRAYLKEQTKKKAPGRKIRINASGCLDRCELGPLLVSYPEGRWFRLKTREDVDRFIESYILDSSQNIEFEI